MGNRPKDYFVPNEARRFSRRNILGWGVVGTGATLLGAKLGLNPEWRSGVAAGVTNKYRLPNTRENPDGEILYPSEKTLQETWQSHFKDKEHLMSYEAWSNKKRPSDNRDMGVGRNMAVFTTLTYAEEKKPGEDYDSYFKRYLDQMHALSEIAGLDFVVLVSTLKISAQNLSNGEDVVKKHVVHDMKETSLQEVVVTTARILGLEAQFLKLFSPDSPIIHMLDAIHREEIEKAKREHRELPNYFGLRGGGEPYYNIIRAGGEPTIGMMDMEPQERASAYVKYAREDPALRKRFLEKVLNGEEIEYNYYEVVRAQEYADITRKKLSDQVDKYIQQHKTSLERFAMGDQTGLDAIGLGEDIDDWQLCNYTYAWYEIIQFPYRSRKEIIKKIRETIRNEAQDDPDRFYRKLMGQQLRNKRFMTFLKAKAYSQNDQQEMQDLQALQTGVDAYEKSAEALRTVRNETLALEQPLEFNIFFQQLTSILVTKALSEKAGPFDPNDQNSLYWNIYKTIAIREIAPPYLLMNGSRFMRDKSIDNPYAPDDLLPRIDEFAEMLLDKGLIGQLPQNDMRSFIRTVLDMQYNSDNDGWKDRWPQLSQQEWDVLIGYFRAFLITRFENYDSGTPEYPPLTRSQHAVKEMFWPEEI